MKRKAVWYTKEQIDLWKKLVKENKSSEKFNDFVKSAFHDKVDKLNNGGKKSAA